MSIGPLAIVIYLALAAAFVACTLRMKNAAMSDSMRAREDAEQMHAVARRDPVMTLH
jgi:hypothetical protein